LQGFLLCFFRLVFRCFRRCHVSSDIFITQRETAAKTALKQPETAGSRQQRAAGSSEQQQRTTTRASAPPLIFQSKAASRQQARAGSETTTRATTTRAASSQAKAARAITMGATHTLDPAPPPSKYANPAQPASHILYYSYSQKPQFHIDFIPEMMIFGTKTP